MARINGVLRISITNWSKYQERPDRKNYTWFKFESDFFRDSKMYGLSKDQKLLFVFLLCQRNRANKDEFDIIIDETRLFMNSEIKELINNLKVLNDNALISIRDLAVIARAKSGVTPSLDKIRLDKIREDKNNGQNEFDLESLYFQYPRKVKKKKGIEKLRLLIKSQEQFDLIKKSILNYSDYCSKHVTESRYIMHFSTFVHSWEDWLEPKSEFKKEIGPKPLSPPSGIPEELTRPDPRVGPLDPAVKRLLDQALGKL